MREKKQLEFICFTILQILDLCLNPHQVAILDLSPT